MDRVLKLLVCTASFKPIAADSDFAFVIRA
jgi:hypothetical protein